MNTRFTEVICGPGQGKTAMAMGKCLQKAAQGESVIVIQFLKGREEQATDILEKLDSQDVKIFRFERMNKCYADLTDEEKNEERLNIRNGVNFARKVIATQECEVLVLDEILGLLDNDILEEQTLREILQMRDPSIHIIMTGWRFPDSLRDCVDSITTVTTEDKTTR
ncbi:MAG: cob(I)yrinic acid a,c-diamide adenosyltransferase [Eubacteriales bacterium]|nr:cob(I)yrinic acid a,c-diamide adenosyltransferase [Eubacteriales bacterium]